MVQSLALLSALVPAVLGATYTVTLGIDQTTGQVGIGYDPNRILPAIGDQVVFSWSIPSYITDPQTGSYSATQGSADAPCQALSGGFDSGPQTTAPEASGTAPSQTFTITTSDPLYFYSSVDGQCQEGMALGINTPATGAGSIDSYINTATGGAGPVSSNTTSSSPSSSSSATASTSASATTSLSSSSASSHASTPSSSSKAASAASASSTSKNSGVASLTASSVSGWLKSVTTAAVVGVLGSLLI